MRWWNVDVDAGPLVSVFVLRSAEVIIHRACEPLGGKTLDERQLQ